MSTMTTNTAPKTVGPSRRALYAALALVLLSMIPGIFVPAAKPLAYIVPLVYILVERKRVGRSWEEIGIKVGSFRKDFLDNWPLFLLVAVFIQLAIVLVARAFWPDLLAHIRERVPFLSPSSLGALILTVIVIAFIEELIYRGLLQQRLNWYLNGCLAVVIASVVFGVQHFTPGKPAIVAADIATVVIDGLVFGWIFARCRNVLVSWPAHVAADLVAIAILIQSRAL
jgi:membrane protease YdiL (CAAX protease family)